MSDKMKTLETLKQQQQELTAETKDQIAEKTEAGRDLESLPPKEREAELSKILSEYKRIKKQADTREKLDQATLAALEKIPDSIRFLIDNINKLDANISNLEAKMKPLAKAVAKNLETAKTKDVGVKKPDQLMVCGYYQ